MKKINVSLSAAFIAAFLFSCGGSAEKGAASDSAGMKPGMEMGKSGKDTSVIKEGQEVFFANLKDGQILHGPVTVKFGLKGMKVAPLDSGVHEGMGHHHLLVDTMTFIPAGESVPMIDKKVLHYGKGQKQSKPLKLKKGKHTLSLQFADGVHRSYGIRMSKTIHITIK